MELQRLYSDLLSYHRFNKKGGNDTSYSIHKRFSDSSGLLSVNQWLLKRFSVQGKAVLDMGCGVGETTKLLAEEGAVKIVGVSVCADEIQLATSLHKDIGNLSFVVGDFEKDNFGVFDVVLAIESLKHSKDLKNVAKQLGIQIRKGGELVVVEDVSNSSSLKNFNLYKKAWCLNELYSEKNYMDALKHVGFVHQESEDMTKGIRIPKFTFLKLKISLFKLMYSIFPNGKVSRTILIFLGGFLMDEYYAKGQMKYKAMIFKKV